jgi:uncharacterized protein
MDGDQSYRDNETTSRSSIVEFAKEFGVDNVEIVDLAGAQFRCGGSAEYMDWLDELLELRAPGTHQGAWRKGHGGPFEFEIAESPIELESRLRSKMNEGHSVRLLASYARPWKTKKSYQPHDLPAVDQDFAIECGVPSGLETWSRVWNYAPEQDYTLFVQAPEGSAMGADQLAEVGCPYVVRGFDFDTIGLLWLKDLVRRGDRWVANLDHIHESAWKKTRSQARKEGGSGPHADELLERLKRGYRILLSRGIRGAQIWFEDDETREFVETKLGG